MRRDPEAIYGSDIAAACALAELLEVHAQFPVVVVFLQLVPGGFAAGVGGCAAQHAGERGFNTGGDLVVELAAGDALNEAAVLFAIGVDEVVGEGAVGREASGLGRVGRAIGID